MHMAAHVFHAAQAAHEPEAADTVGRPLDEKGPDEIRDDRHELGHASMVALSGRSVKRGELGCDWGGPGINGGPSR
jgi:hypothetical protein